MSFILYIQWILSQPMNRPTNKEELFNLQHASLCNIIERTFGIFKCQFCLLNTCPEYSISTQACFVAALAALYNFIQYHEPPTSESTGLQPTSSFQSINHSQGPYEDQEEPYPLDSLQVERNQLIMPAEWREASEWRDKIAEEM